MKNYSKIGGILSIVAGGFGCLSGLAVIAFAIIMGIFMNGGSYHYFGYNGYASADGVFLVMMIVYGVCGVIGLIVSALAIVGGIFSIRKKVWGLALAGAIAGTLVFFPCGVVAIIFTALGKPEFDTPLPPAAM